MPLYAIVACVKNAVRGSGSPVRTLNDTALLRVLLPSLVATIHRADRELWTVRRRRRNVPKKKWARTQLVQALPDELQDARRRERKGCTCTCGIEEALSL